MNQKMSKLGMSKTSQMSLDSHECYVSEHQEVVQKECNQTAEDESGFDGSRALVTSSICSSREELQEAGSPAKMLAKRLSEVNLSKGKYVSTFSRSNL